MTILHLYNRRCLNISTLSLYSFIKSIIKTRKPLIKCLNLLNRTACKWNPVYHLKNKCKYLKFIWNKVLFCLSLLAQVLFVSGVQHQVVTGPDTSVETLSPTEVCLVVPGPPWPWRKLNLVLQNWPLYRRKSRMGKVWNVILILGLVL